MLSSCYIALIVCPTPFEGPRTIPGMKEVLPRHYPHPKLTFWSLYADIDAPRNPTEKGQNIQDEESPTDFWIAPKSCTSCTIAHDESRYDVVSLLLDRHAIVILNLL